MLIKTDNLGRWYQRGKNQVQALKSVSVSIHKGEFVAVMGPSGSGKSTLLHILGCLDRPSAGTYRYGGHNVEQISDRALSSIRAHQMGFIFQTFNLLPQLTVYENVALPFSYQHPSHHVDWQSQVMSAIESVGLGHRTSHQPNELSGGEMQRTAIARAMVIRPQLILADEPTGNLDSRNSGEIMRLIQQLHGAGTTVVMVTHDAQTAACASRTLTLKDGGLVA